MKPLTSREYEANLTLKIWVKQMKIRYIEDLLQLALMNSC